MTPSFQNYNCQNFIFLISCIYNVAPPLNAAVRRQKQLEHRRAVENLIEDRRATFDVQRAAEIQEHQEKINRESCRAQIIEEERQRILQEHADKLVGYMPKGVFNTFGEVQKLGNDALEQSYGECSKKSVKVDKKLIF